jgi:glycosyltransferase involved in cell wall biosynthesis
MSGTPRSASAPSYVEHFRDPPPEMLVRLYREADVYLSPSLAEGWHLPPMEAMACGCALVATRVGCIPVLDEGDNMVTASPGDRDGLFAGLDALAREPARLREVARKGRATILRYGWDEKAAAFEGTLLALTGR